MNRKRQKLFIGILFLTIAIISILYRTKRNSDPNQSYDRYSGSTEPIKRDVSRLVYTKHARCRMDCRNISKEEVEEILVEGKVNYTKSAPNSKPDPKFAFEGVTDDGQPVRIIFANSERGIVVVTVIDLEREYSCNCN